MKNFGIQKLILGFLFWGSILRNTLKIVENITLQKFLIYVSLCEVFVRMSDIHATTAPV